MRFITISFLLTLQRSLNINGPTALWLTVAIGRYTHRDLVHKFGEVRTEYAAVRNPRIQGGLQVKKLRHEAELFKAALLAGVKYAEGRGAVEFEATDSASDKALYVYRLLVHDKAIAPMPEDQVGEKTIRHRLATWYAHQLPKGHPLLD
jgi:hypothetical protein